MFFFEAHGLQNQTEGTMKSKSCETFGVSYTIHSKLLPHRFFSKYINGFCDFDKKVVLDFRVLLKIEPYLFGG